MNTSITALTCAGSKGEPQFDDAAFEAIYRASGGIPRRINALCDRLLLLGFLSDRKSFGKNEVDEVVSEMSSSATGIGVPARDAALLAPRALGDDFRDETIGPLSFDAETAAEAGKTIFNLSNRRIADRLLRLERSLVRLEHANTLMLRVMQQLVDAARASKPEKEQDKKADKGQSKSDKA